MTAPGARSDSRLLQVLAKLARAGAPETMRAAMPNPTPELVKARAAGRG